jgi:hypothetical protein
MAVPTAINRHVAGAETVEIVERNMSKADMRGTAILPGSKDIFNNN